MMTLRTKPESFDKVLRRRKATWLVWFCFCFGAVHAGLEPKDLWGRDFEFQSEFRMIIKPDVLKRTSSDHHRFAEHL